MEYVLIILFITFFIYSIIILYLKKDLIIIATDLLIPSIIIGLIVFIYCIERYCVPTKSINILSPASSPLVVFLWLLVIVGFILLVVLTIMVIEALKFSMQQWQIKNFIERIKELKEIRDNSCYSNPAIDKIIEELTNEFINILK